MNEAHSAKVVAASEKHFLEDADGYLKFFPDGHGMYEAHHLRIIADELDKRNAEWDEKVSKAIMIGPHEDMLDALDGLFDNTSK